MTEPAVSFSAPGKIIVIGEYAVLEGGAAYVRAVDVRARARVRPRAAGSLLEAPDIGVPAIEFSTAPGGHILWQGAEQSPSRVPSALGLAAAVLSDAFSDAPPRPCRIGLDTSEFFGETRQGAREKIGLGSSAAVTVALHAAARRWACGEDAGPHDVASTLVRLQALHRHHQGGRGSGLDIAASLHGGTFVYRRGDPHPALIPVPLPPGLELLCVWSGRSASTGGFLERLSVWRRRNERAYERYMGELSRIAEDGIKAATSRDPAAFRMALREYTRSLDGLGAATSLPIVSPVHRRIERLASKHGLTYKPSGAGGGDIGIAVADDPRATRRFQEAVESDGFLVLSCPETPVGLRYEEETGDAG